MSKRTGTGRTNKGPWKHQVKAKRRLAAEERQDKHNTLTPQERLANLDKFHFEAKKERAKLAKLIG